MNHRSLTPVHHFFATASLPCPYLPGRTERRLVTDLTGRQAAAFHDVLSQAGFRRSHCVAYVPICRGCNACAAVRVKALAFEPSRTHRRIWTRNRDLIAQSKPPRATDEQFTLFRAYQKARHGDGEMAQMDYYDYQALVEDTPVATNVLELRSPRGVLHAVCVFDRVADGFSAVYSFFQTEETRRSLGTYVILSLIEYARATGLPHVYLGFWIADCSKMSYKANFRPLEVYTQDGWRCLDTNHR